jgi:hypothetical protein
MFKSYFREDEDEDYFGPRTRVEFMVAMEANKDYCNKCGCNHAYEPMGFAQRTMGGKDPRMGKDFYR